MMRNSGCVSTLYLVSCVKGKRAEPLPAKELYDSTRFKLCRRYVEGLGGRWLILSAKHGVVSPEEVIAPYDTYMGSLTIAQRRRWADGVMGALEPHLGGVRRVCFLAGRDYYGLLLQPLERRGVAVETPLAHMRQGEQMAWLKKEAQR